MINPPQSQNEDSLQRFVDAQNECYGQVLKELSLGKKTSHWIWFIFPQIRGLGFSEYSQYFGIDGPLEAKAYWKNPLLKKRYEECLQLTLQVNDSPLNILGRTDSQKLQSSITLFLSIAPNSELLHLALEQLFKGEFDKKTVRILASSNQQSN